jgi:hypothetical protein
MREDNFSLYSKMSAYPPPQETTSIFNSQEFLIPLNATITKADADASYLARTGIATSNASITNFAGQVQVSPSASNTGTNGLQVQGAIFGRNDITANSFSGTLGYTYHPVGWTITMNKVIANLPSGSTSNIITFGTANTEFNTMSNGLWLMGCNINNVALPGVMTRLSTEWGVTGGTILNIGANFTLDVSAGNFRLDASTIVARVTGNGTTSVVFNFLPTWTVQPTLTFIMYAIKLG